MTIKTGVVVFIDELGDVPHVIIGQAPKGLGWWVQNLETGATPTKNYRIKVRNFNGSINYADKVGGYKLKNMRFTTGDVL